MSDKRPPPRCDDESTWRQKGKTIDLPGLLKLIEKNGGPQGLDLHGADLHRLDASPETLSHHLDHYRRRHGADAWPPWLAPRAWNVTSIHLSGAHLEHARLWSAHLEKAYLDRAHLQNAFLFYAHLDNAYALAADLQYAHLRSAHMENAKLDEAHLENANLRRAHLENARLIDAHLENADLQYAHLENADLTGARLYPAFWHGSYLDHTRVRRQSLGRAIGDELAAKGHPLQSRFAVGFHYARETYLALKTNFDSIGRYEDASWAYVKEQQMEKAMHLPTTAGHRWIRKPMGGAVPPPWQGPQRLPRWLWWKLRSAFYHCRLFVGLCPSDIKRQTGEEQIDRLRWLRNWFYEATCGYGENPWRPVIWTVVVVLLFALIYAGAGNIASGDGGGTHNFLTALTHSIGAFATIGFNTLEPVGWGARLLTAVEAMFGIGLFALFVFTLGNRMRRS